MSEGGPAARPLRFAPAAVDYEPLPGGDGWRLSSRVQVGDTATLLLDRLASVAKSHPSRPLVVERDPAGGWRACAYGAAWQRSGEIAQALLAWRSARVGEPLFIVGGASIAQLLLRLGAMRAGVPFVPISVPSLRWGGADRWRHLAAQFSPTGVAVAPEADFVETGDLPRLSLSDRGLEDWQGSARSASPTLPAVTADTTAAVFLTSGSTGPAKGVPLTHRMIAANQAGYAAVWPFLTQHPPVIVDWLPWHHTFGGNDNLHKAIWFGGTYVVDDGQPTPERFARTLEALRLHKPTFHANVPKGLALLATALETDRTFADAFFERLDVLFFAGAAMDTALWGRLSTLVDRARQRVGRNIALVSGYGSTETGSTVTLVHFPITNPAVIGLPLPGLDLKLVRQDGKLEIRVKGANVMSAYWQRADATTAAFDADGYFCTGDAARFLDETSPERGLLFDGRLGEDFKLSTGTWVSVGPVRARLLALLPPDTHDILIAGEGRDRLGVILLASEPLPQTAVADAVSRYNHTHPGSSTAVSRVIWDRSPPHPSEISDKGHLNQRLALANRRHLIEQLFAPMPSQSPVILFDEKAP